jgi:hypothetical protein
MCDQPATTREHSPPRCFFPNKGAGLQLATVASCDSHNGKKSGDDIYVLAQICMNAARSGNLAQNIFLRSVAPQVVEKEKFKTLLTAGSRAAGDGAVAYRVNLGRIDSFFDHLSAAMYWAKFKESYAYAMRPMRHEYLNFISEDADRQRDVNELRICEKLLQRFRSADSDLQLRPTR